MFNDKLFTLTNIQIIDCAIQEIENKTFGVTEQFLEIHEIVYEDGRPKVDRVDTDKGDIVVVYFPVKNENFYFAIYINTSPDISIVGAGVESNNCVYFKAYSEVFNFSELASMTVLKPTSGWNRGDRKGHAAIHKNSLVRYEPNPEPDEFEDKLRRMLDFLEQDKEGVKRLADNANAIIQVAITFHNGNGMLGGPHIGNDSLQRISALNLAIDFDFYAEGNAWK